ncbi:MAG: acylphosphatase [Candidatus Hydrogenedentota bacterium]|nr:MAG: acylphosphatase [Candidatus Hydrogenedentota bacterium]
MTEALRRRRVRFVVSGFVQGVGFRWFVREEAASRGLTGFVRNCPDGTVRGEAEGERALLEEFLESLRRGPSAARVDGVEIQEIPCTHRKGFRIEF